MPNARLSDTRTVTFFPGLRTTRNPVQDHLAVFTPESQRWCPAGRPYTSVFFLDSERHVHSVEKERKLASEVQVVRLMRGDASTTAIRNHYSLFNAKSTSRPRPRAANAPIVCCLSLVNCCPLRNSTIWDSTVPGLSHGENVKTRGNPVRSG